MSVRKIGFSLFVVDEVIVVDFARRLIRQRKTNIRNTYIAIKNAQMECEIFRCYHPPLRADRHGIIRYVNGWRPGA